MMAILQLQHLDTSQTYGEETRWELHYNAARCFEQILDSASKKKKKTSAVWSLTSHLSNYPSKTREHAVYC